MKLDVAYAHISRIIDVSEEDKRIFESLVEVQKVRKKTLLLEEGQLCAYEYFILEGCVRSYYTDENFIEHTIMFAIEGWWTGNLKSFVRNTPSDFSLQAQEDTIVLRLSKPKLEKLYAQVRILLQNRLLATQDRISNHLSSSASERYAQFLKKYPQIEQRVPLKHIASYLGITPTYLSRLRKKNITTDFLY